MILSCCYRHAKSLFLHTHTETVQALKNTWKRIVSQDLCLLFTFQLASIGICNG